MASRPRLPSTMSFHLPLRPVLREGTLPIPSIGSMMNERYTGSEMCTPDEPVDLGTYQQGPQPTLDPTLYHIPGICPRYPVSYAWLDRAVPSLCVATIDPAEEEVCSLFTGPGGEMESRCKRPRLRTIVNAHSAKFLQDRKEVHYSGESLCGMGLTSAMLVNLNVSVAWRATHVIGRSRNARRNLSRFFMDSSAAS